MANDERVYMVEGQDENGDQHLFATDSRERAEAKLAEMRKTLKNVRGNLAFDPVTK